MRSLVKCYSLDYDLEIAKAGRRVEFDISMTDTVGGRCTKNDGEIFHRKDVAFEVDN